MFFAYRGLEDTNDATFLVSEYIRLQSLAKLGFKFDGDSISDLKAEVFSIIGDEISRIEAKDAKKRSGKGR